MRIVSVQIGDVFSRWTVMQPGEQAKTSVLCRCECGTVRAVSIRTLRRGESRSCGCLLVDFCRSRFVTHGQSIQGHSTQEYMAWRHMMSRCTNPKDASFQYYGGRGITVFAEWITSFPSFYAYIGPIPHPGFSIERLNTNGNYEPGNVVWASATQQIRNRRNTLMLTVHGETKPLAQWAEESGINWATLRARIHEGKWTPERAVSERVRNPHDAAVAGWVARRQGKPAQRDQYGRFTEL